MYIHYFYTFFKQGLPLRLITLIVNSIEECEYNLDNTIFIFMNEKKINKLYIIILYIYL